MYTEFDISGLEVSRATPKTVAFERNGLIYLASHKVGNHVINSLRMKTDDIFFMTEGPNGTKWIAMPMVW